MDSTGSIPQSMMLGEMEPAEVLADTTTYYNNNLK